jgi:isoquinoline 1-oxidoreductase subunit beta
MSLRHLCADSRSHQARSERDMSATSIFAGKDGRRNFIKTVALVGGGLTFGVEIPALSRGETVFAPDAFVRIDRSGAVTLIMPQVEMGQGIYTSIAMILAEELDVSLDRVVLQPAPPDDSKYTNRILGFQVTGGSTSIRAFWGPMRQTGASARALLVAAAAEAWKVPESDCRTDAGVVRHPATGREVPYGALIERASQLKPKADVPLKLPSAFKLIGEPIRRLDTPDKVNGEARFGIDAMPPGFKVATLVTCPVFGGRVSKVDSHAAESIAGVRQVVVLDDLVAVIGDHMWAAKRGVEALKIDWDLGPHANENTVELLAQHRAALNLQGVVAKNHGDLDAAFAIGKPVEVEYHVPFLAHAPMEPMNCTALVLPSSCEIWVGTQVITRAQAVAAKVTGLPLRSVTVNNHLLGGGFGRRLEVDYVEIAVRIAQKAVGTPVKVVWTRKEDIRKARYRPMYADRLKAKLENGRITAWHHRIVGSSVIARWDPAAFKDGIDTDAVDGAIDFPYGPRDLRVEYCRFEPASVPTCFWRGVGPTHNIFVIESFVDELAHRAGQDPVAFRRAQLTKQPRALACLELAASKSNWGAPLGARAGRGVAVQTVFDGFMATVAEVEVDVQGGVRVRRYTCAVDCGVVVNPDTVIAQIQGGLIYGLTAVLFGQVTLEKGRVQQSNFNDYRMLRIHEAPAIDVHVIPSNEAPGGIGEPGTTAAAAPVANAIFSATGVRLRHLPIDRVALAVGA